MKIAAYGTLRGGLHSAKYLTNKYGIDSVKVLGEYELPGFNLFTRPFMGIDCPFAVPGDGTLKVTLLDIGEDGPADDIDRGESWAYDKTLVLVPDFGEAFIYQARDHQDSRYKLVANGDYLKRDEA